MQDGDAASMQRIEAQLVDKLEGAKRHGDTELAARIALVLAGFREQFAEDLRCRDSSDGLHNWNQRGDAAEWHCSCGAKMANH